MSSPEPRVAGAFELRVGRHRVELTHPDKVLFPAEGITKADLVDYYRSVAPVALTHLQGRPLMLERYPDGVGHKGFYQKAAPGNFPGWIRRVDVEKSGGSLRHVVCDDEATLAYLAGQACVTTHVWLSRADRLRRPDRIVFDLDPSGDDFELVRIGARTIRQLLEAIGLVAFVQTTGSRGLHVVAPIDRRHDVEDVHACAKAVAAAAVAAEPDRLTDLQRKDRRRGRVLIDVMRNAYAQTVVAPYAVRPRSGAPVATPLTWKEVDDPRLTSTRFTMADVPARLQRQGDPWADIARLARSLGRAWARLVALDRGRAERATATPGRRLPRSGAVQAPVP